MYGLLHYPGDVRELASGVTVTRSDGGTERTVPALLGADAAGLPYEVLDVDYDAELDRSTVHLGPASPDTVRGNRSALFHQQQSPEAAELRADHARARHFWRPDVWAPPADLADRIPGVRAALARAEAAKGAA